MTNKNGNLLRFHKISKNEQINSISKKFQEIAILIMAKLIKSLFIKIVAIILLIIMSIFIYKDILNINISNNIDYNTFLKESYESIDLAYINSLNFVKSCESRDLIHFESSIDYNLTNPKISVVIPLFNCEKYILRAIKSIQLQNLSNFEIILIDDKSEDNTLNLLSIIQKEDQRIKIIRNQKNMGILYTRSIGVLMSKGKYLFNLDNDDLFMNNDIFDTITKLSDKGNFDIVEFKAISNKKINQNILNMRYKNSIFSHQKPFILFQPELGMFPIPTGNISGSYQLKDIFLWGKCIKTKIYQKALNKLGPDRYSRLMIRYEDIVTNYMICNTAKSFIYIEKYGIYHIVRSGSGVEIGWMKVPRIINLLYLIDIVIDFSLNTINNKKLAAYLIIYYLHLRNTKKLLTSSTTYMNLFISCLRRVFNSTYISDYNKNEIRSIIKNLKYINFKE